MTDPLIGSLLALVVVGLVVALGLAGFRYFKAPEIFGKFLVAAGVVVAALLLLRVLLTLL